MPPAAAITGTLNWTVAAWVALSPWTAEYQLAYPIPDVIAPDATADAMPRVAGWLAGSYTTSLPSGILSLPLVQSWWRRSVSQEQSNGPLSK